MTDPSPLWGRIWAALLGFGLALNLRNAIRGDRSTLCESLLRPLLRVATPRGRRRFIIGYPGLAVWFGLHILKRAAQAVIEDDR